jgi:hypothetical protein
MSQPTTLQPSNQKTDPISPPDRDQKMAERRRRSFAVPIGCFLVGLAVLLSGTVLESTILPAGTIVGTARRAAVLGLCRILLAAAGAYFLVRRPRVTAIHLSALLPGGLLAGIAGAVLLQVAYVPPPIVCGWRSFAPAAEQNQLGYRGRKIAYSPDDYVVVLLGDSQVEAMALPFDEMPERRLEAYLDSPKQKAKVFSLGAGGYGQDQELLALQDYFQRYRADLVVLWQTPSNDIWNNVFKTHMANRNPKPTFWLEESGKLHGPSEGLGQPLANSRIVVASLWQRAFGLPWRDKSWERQLPEPYVPMDHYDGPVRRDWQERWDTNLGSMRDENLDTEKSHMAGLLIPRSKRIQYGLDLTRALTQRIQDVVTANHGQLVLFQVDPDDPTAPSEGEQVYVLNNKYYRVSKHQLQDNWSYVNRGFDTEIIPITVKNWRVGPEDGHLNKQATEQAMSALAERLRPTIAEKTGHRGAPIRNLK